MRSTLGLLPVAFALPLALASTHQPRANHHALAKRAKGDLMEKRDTFDGARWTYYSTGLGACGGTNSDSDFIVALNQDTFGTAYPSQYCYQQITMTYNGKTTTATIVDSCPGCPSPGGLDLSPGLFSFFADESVGVIYGDWSFVDGSGGSGGDTTTSTTQQQTTTAAPPPTTTHTTTKAEPTTTEAPPAPKKTTTSTKETTTSTKETTTSTKETTTSTKETTTSTKETTTSTKQTTTSTKETTTSTKESTSSAKPSSSSAKPSSSSAKPSSSSALPKPSSSSVEEVASSSAAADTDPEPTTPAVVGNVATQPDSEPTSSVAPINGGLGEGTGGAAALSFSSALLGAVVLAIAAVQL